MFFNEATFLECSKICLIQPPKSSSTPSEDESYVLIQNLEHQREIQSLHSLNEELRRRIATLEVTPFCYHFEKNLVKINSC